MREDWKPGIAIWLIVALLLPGGEFRRLEAKPKGPKQSRVRVTTDKLAKRLVRKRATIRMSDGSEIVGEVLGGTETELVVHVQSSPSASPGVVKSIPVSQVVQARYEIKKKTCNSILSSVLFGITLFALLVAAAWAHNDQLAKWAPVPAGALGCAVCLTHLQTTADLVTIDVVAPNPTR